MSWGPGIDSDGSEARSGSAAEWDGQDPSDEDETAESESESPDEEVGRESGVDFEEMEPVETAFRRGEYAFLPVFGFNEANVAAKKYVKEHGLEDDERTINTGDEPLMIGGKEMTWWEDNSIMPKHPYMLVNPLGFASVDPDEFNFREVFRVEKDEHFVFSDSGGYQLMSMEDAEIVSDPEDHRAKDYRIHPETLMQWQVENADAGATVDFPPYNITGDSSFPDAVEYGEDWRDFFIQRREASRDMTYRMASRLAELREEDHAGARDYIFAPVIHGKPHPRTTHTLVENWHEEMLSAAVDGGVVPRGWVVKPEPSHNFGQIAMHLGYAADRLTDADFIHVLMVGGLLQKALIMYFATLTDFFVTSDASSYAAGGMRRQFNLPKTATRRSVIISSRDDDDDGAAMNPNRLDRYPCRCQVCNTVERNLGFDFIVNGSGSTRCVCLNLHNLHQILNVERTVDALLREEDAELVSSDGEPTGAEFWRYLKSIGSENRIEDLYAAMDYVRLAVEESIDAANARYRILWSKKSGRTIVRGSNSAADW